MDLGDDEVDGMIMPHDYGSNDGRLIEARFPRGTLVEIMGSDRLGIILGGPVMVHPLDEQWCRSPKTMGHTRKAEGTTGGSYSHGCTYPNCNCPVSAIDKDKFKWVVEVLVGTVKKPLDPWLLCPKN